VLPAYLVSMLSLLVVAIGVVANWLSPRWLLRRRLIYQVSHSTQLINTLASSYQNIKVLHNDDRKLDNPYVLEFSVHNTGWDITRDQFDGQPLVFDLKGEVIEILRLTSNFDGGRLPLIEFDENRLILSPDLFPRRGRVAFVVLTEGRPTVGTPSHHLAHTKISDSETSAKRSTRAAIVGSVVGLTGFATWLVAQFIYYANSSDPKIKWYNVDTWPKNGSASLSSIMKILDTVTHSVCIVGFGCAVLAMLNAYMYEVRYSSTANKDSAHTVR
jgi:hypothetical protein